MSNPDSTLPTVSADRLRAECLRRRYLSLLDKPEVFPSAINWEYIIAHRMPELGPKLYRKYLVSLLTADDARCDYHLAAIEYFPRYLAVIDRNEALETVYSDRDTLPEAFHNLVEKLQLADFDRIADILAQGDTVAAIRLSGCDCPDYTFATLRSMEHLLDDIAALPEQGSIEERRGLLGVSRRYICPQGHANDADAVYCTHPGCGLDICGLTAGQRDAVRLLALKTDALRHLLQR